MLSFSFLVIIYAGFLHAFETDHLLAVSSIVSQRTSIKLSLKDGLYWGLGHTSTIFLMGMVMILSKVLVPPRVIHYFEAMVGIMLGVLAIYRLWQFFGNKQIVIHAHGGGQHKRFHLHIVSQYTARHEHAVAYGVGLVHGLAGSGGLILLLLTRIKTPVEGLAYLLIFGAGCIGGMLLAAGLFSLPFSKKIMQGRGLQIFLIISSSVCCLLYGARVIYENLIA